MLLLSDESSFLVGQTVYVDGGQHLVAPVLEPGVPLA
jgi:enoyl-[acyl-carrier-protein] reductase (NADH)